MGKFKSVYKGNLRIESTHLQSGTKIETDAPTDNNGKGERFSPTDLVATGLANCMTTIMGIKAEQMGLNLNDLNIEIEKIMAASPRRIAEIKIDFHIKGEYSDKVKKILENAAATCPVAQSLHPETKQTVNFHWK